MERAPRIAVVSFPGNNCEVESLRAVRKAGMEPMFFRWNDDRSKLRDVDGYLLPGGFSYEDRGRSGMVPARDPLMEIIRADAEQGKVVLGICNGAQILVESGLIPNGDGLEMSLARNALAEDQGLRPTGFLGEWIWITRTCDRDRCAGSSWDGVMQIPIAHGEGRFTTKDPDLLDELKQSDQIAFQYCSVSGQVSADPQVTPNGSADAIAGICNPEGNVVALMPHPERAFNEGQAFFAAVRDWLLQSDRRSRRSKRSRKSRNVTMKLEERPSGGVEIFIETIITNNEERTVEQAARRIAPKLRLKQWKYRGVPSGNVSEVLSDLTVFNHNKERASIRRAGEWRHWNHGRKTEDEASQEMFRKYSLLLRQDDTDDINSGIAYGIEGISEQDLYSNNELLEVFANPHASTLERL